MPHSIHIKRVAPPRTLLLIVATLVSGGAIGRMRRKLPQPGGG